MMVDGARVRLSGHIRARKLFSARIYLRHQVSFDDIVDQLNSMGATMVISQLLQEGNGI